MQTENKKIKMKDKIRLRDLSWVLKIAAIALLVDAVYYAWAFLEGFFSAL